MIVCLAGSSTHSKRLYLCTLDALHGLPHNEDETVLKNGIFRASLVALCRLMLVHPDSGSCWRRARMITGTLIHTLLYGRKVGSDEFGNRYYEARKTPATGERRRRWVLFNGEPEASKVPPHWHAWLHYTTDAPISVASHEWEKGHSRNLTGSSLAYVPPGDDRAGGCRSPATGDYEPWRPV